MTAGTWTREDGAVERFTWDGATWRSSFPGGRLELTAGPELRVHAEAGGWVLRAGTAGPSVLWRRGAQEHEAVADGVTGANPAYDLVLVRRFALEVGEVRRVRLLLVTEPVLATRLVDAQWTRTAVDAYDVADLATGERRRLQLVDGLPDGLTLTRA